eukprot:TRINITY_DN76118_c0_g1_i1.p1 TRINITY_DN76118_c0_g1~~TRINITY_DN76118_c0_g1_i1.p1  ORF type:complete len:396 (-),score=36.70 TRINITY_DN76118_c0_g1_i1:172-1359(-)
MKRAGSFVGLVDEVVLARRRLRSVVRRQCIICAEERPLLHFEDDVTTACIHSRDICKPCMARAIMTEIETKGQAARPVCFSQGCGAELSLADVSRETSPEVAARLDELLLQRALSEQQTFCWCAHPGCGAGQLLDAVGPNIFMRCQKCDRRTCTHHRSVWHDERTCAQHDEDLQKMQEEEQHSYVVDNSKLRSSAVGLTLRRSMDLSDKMKGNRVAWGSTIQGTPVDKDWIRVGEYFLPLRLRRVRVLRPKKQTYQLDNSILRSSKSSIRFRASTSMHDKTSEEVRWGSLLNGVPVDKDWVRVGSSFLPVRVKGKRILRVQSGLNKFIEDKGIQRCPKCRQGIEKRRGCDHMKCPCGAEFCYICGADYKGPGGVLNVGNHAHREDCRHYRAWHGA